MINLKFNIERMYHFSPQSIQNIWCTLEGWKINISRYNNSFKKLLKDKENKAFLSKDEIINYRNRRLIDFIKWSYRTVPYYRRLFDNLGASPCDFKSIEDLQKLPILSRRQVQENLDKFISEKIPIHQQKIVHTSGSTGSGLRFPATIDAIQEQFAVYWRFLGWHGLARDMWKGYFGGCSIVPIHRHKPPFWRYNHPGKQIIFSGYHISPENLPYYINIINKAKPPWLVGYPSLITLLADYILDTGNVLHYPLQGISLSSENLMDHQITKIKDAFGIKPIQDYGQVEAVANFSECECGHMHVDEDFSAVEFIPLDRDNNCYRVIGTNYSNLATPLIRYDTGDVVTIDSKGCECGRPGRVVKSVDGRREDYIILKNGAKIGRMDHIFKDLIDIKEAQLYQRVPGQIEVRIVKGIHYNKSDEMLLLNEFRKRVGIETDVKIRYMDRLPRTMRGKLRFVLSDIPEGKISSYDSIKDTRLVYT